jgi:hypothetical protein
VVTHMDMYCRLAELERARQHEALLWQMATVPPGTTGRRGRLRAAVNWRSRPRPISDDASLEWRARPLRPELRTLLDANGAG